MGLASWLWSRPGPVAPESHAKGGESLVAVVSPWKTNTELPDNHDYEALSRDGYERNPVVWACVNAIASSVAEPDLRLYRGGEVIDEHDVLTLLDRPNADEDGFEFLYRLLVYYCLAGEAVVHKVRAATGRVVQLQLLRPDRVEPVVDKVGRVSRYAYKIDGAKIVDIDPRNVVVMRRLHPRDDFRGLSPITVAARFADLDNQGADFLRSVLANGGIPRALLKFKQRVDPEGRLSVKHQWRDQYGSVNGWNDVAVIDEDVEFQRIGLNPTESDLSNIFGETESRICMSFGVPPILIGAKVGIDRATYSNYEQAMRSFWQQTLSPLFVQVAARLTHGIAREFDERLYLSWDFSGVQAMRESEDAVFQRATKGWIDGVLTLNESRAMIGKPPVVGGDVRRADMAAMLEPVEMETQSTATRLARIDALLTTMEQAA